MHMCMCMCMCMCMHMCNRLTRPGYVDDPRNTDNAWLETSAYHFHCSRELGGMLLLDGRDDPTKKNGMGAVWVTMDEKDEKYEAMYADHKQMVEQVPTRLPWSTCGLPNSLPASLARQPARTPALLRRSSAVAAAGRKCHKAYHGDTPVWMAGAPKRANEPAGRPAHDGGQVGQGRALQSRR